MNKHPSSADIIIAIAKAEAGDWIDPSKAPVKLFDPDGVRSGDGNAYTANEAMALAWLHCWAPDALIDARVEPGSAPFHVPDGWYFELTPPWESR
jgi:hypothetical protein